jgi:hypothetical protein
MLTVLPTVNTTGKMLCNVDRNGRLRTDTSGSLLLFVAVWLYGTPRGRPRIVKLTPKLETWRRILP